jgi:HSP20 family protein
VDKGHLVIAVEPKADNAAQQPTESRYTRREFNYTTFTKSFKLPENVNTTQIKGAHHNGILTLTVPKVELQNVVQTIEIQ